MNRSDARRRVSRYALLIFGFVLISVVAMLLLRRAPAPTTRHPRAIVTTFFPLYDITRAIVGDEVTVVSLIKDTTDPHNYEPSAADVRLLSEARLFVILGVEFEAIEERLLSAIDDAGITIIRAAAGISLLPTRSIVARSGETHATDIEVSGADHERDTDDGAHAYGNDIHVWLSVANARTIARNIVDGIIAVDDSHAATYRANAERYNVALTKLDEQFRRRLQHCEKDTIIVAHNAYQYLAREYQFNVLGIYESDTYVDPSPIEIINLIERARERDIKYILHEEFGNQRLPTIIANESGATLLRMDSIEYVTLPEGDYLSRMERNVRTIGDALECQ